MSDTNLAVLISGGLDSAILLGDALRHPPLPPLAKGGHPSDPPLGKGGQGGVVPIYMRCGMTWEAVEFAYLQRYLDELRCPQLAPLVVLDQPIADVYGPHWSITGQGVPDQTMPDETMFLPGRNVLLLAKSLLWCHLHQVPALALGSLQTNPFPDATPAFFRGFQELINQAMQGSVEVRLPLGGMKKMAVMRMGRGLPLEHTFSCAAPINGLHCGRCNKCAERRHAFIDAGMPDPTRYHG